MKTIRDVEEAQRELGHAIDRYLRARGWAIKCDNPASLWLWQRSMPDGRVLMVSRDTALMFERMTFDGCEEETP